MRSFRFPLAGAGLDKEDSSVNLCDLHVLDTSTLAWSQPQVHGPSPQERRYHTAVVIDKRRMPEFGERRLSCDLAWASDRR